MKIKIAERHATLTDSLRSHIRHKTEGLNRFYDRIISIDVMLSVEKERQIADFHAHLTNKKLIHAHEESPDMYASIDAALDHLKRQLVKRKDQLRSRPSGEPSLFKETEKTDHKKILRTDTYFHKPMSLEEAVLQLDAVEKNFLVFVNAADDELSILYHRDDGNYGLIVPKQ